MRHVVVALRPGEEVVVSGGLGVDGNAKVKIVGASEAQGDDDEDDTK